MLQACKHSFPASHEFPQNFLAGNISIFDHSLSHPRPVCCMTLTTLWNFSDPPQSMTSWLKPFSNQNFVHTVTDNNNSQPCNKLFYPPKLAIILIIKDLISCIGPGSVNHISLTLLMPKMKKQNKGTKSSTTAAAFNRKHFPQYSCLDLLFITRGCPPVYAREF